jgi:Flp pilus assembly protein TadB
MPRSPLKPPSDNPYSPLIAAIQRAQKKLRQESIVAWTLSGLLLAGTIVTAVFIWPVAVVLGVCALVMLAFSGKIESAHKRVAQQRSKLAEHLPRANDGDIYSMQSLTPQHDAHRQVSDEVSPAQRPAAHQPKPPRCV